MRKKSLIALLAALALLSGCGQPAASAPAEAASSAAVSAAEPAPAEEASVPAEEASGPVTTIALNGDSVKIDGPGAQASGAVVTITQNGDYYLSGTLNDGQIIVDVDKDADDVRLHLDGADITCTQGAPIYIQKAKQVYIQLEDGTENTVTDTADYVFAPEEDEPDAAIFSKGDLCFLGTGSLTVTGNYDMAIHGKDVVSINQAGTYDLTAVGDCLKGKDQVLISEATVNVTAGEDGIQSNNDKDEGMGIVTINSGTVNVNAGADGIKAEALLAVLDGTISVTAQEDGLDATFCVQLDGGDITIDAQEDGIQAGSDLTLSGGALNITTGGGSINAPEHVEGRGFPGWFSEPADTDAASAKGLKSDGDLTVSGGTVQIDALDDALHCAGTLTVSGGDLTIATGDDGLHSDDTLVITGGTIDITKSYEGLEALFIDISGGDIALVASDDGLNAAGGNEADFAFMGPPGFGGQAETLEDADYYVHITGGTLDVDAGGDGLDSNGALFIEGGTITVSGPENSMNGALDYTTTGQITGGTAIICGASGMAQNFDSSSTQPSFMYTFDSYLAAGTTVTLTDGSGNVLAEAVMAKSFNSVVISLPELTVGETYILTCRDQTADIELTDTITTVGGWGFGGPGGGPGGMGGPGGGPGGPPGGPMG